MELKKLEKKRKNEKTQHLIRCLSPKSNSKLIFRIFCLFLAYFEQKVAKNMFFCDFLKNGDFWSKFNITNVFRVKFPF